MSSLQRVKKFLEELKQENITFKHHFFERVQERPISEEMARKYLKQTDRLIKVEDQPARKEGEEKYKLWIKLSNKYSFVLIVAIRKKDLYHYRLEY
ncbi:MAG: hypothetical protein KJ597_00350 [Nanoarchaeota archaeon]|nr:hypothetical protein [Nanoarchaeota archaeon]MBU1622004.1 hypothetical protein [Nanoarchaeota archaeon]